MSERQVATASPLALNSVQLHLLRLFSNPMTDMELAEVKALLVEYYDKKMSDELDDIWKKRRFSQKTMDDLLEKHPKCLFPLA